MEIKCLLCDIAVHYGIFLSSEVMMLLKITIHNQYLIIPVVKEVQQPKAWVTVKFPC